MKTFVSLHNLAGCRYSGTSADMYRTIFGLLVSLKLFLGRFDMRTMQVAALPRQMSTLAEPMVCVLEPLLPFVQHQRSTLH